MEKSASANQWIFPHFNRLQQQYLIDNQIFEMLLVFKISFSVSSQHLKLPIKQRQHRQKRLPTLWLIHLLRVLKQLLLLQMLK